MKKHNKIAITAFVVAAIATGISAGCAFLANESITDLPAAFDVNTNSPYFVDIEKETMMFTGDPTADFGSNRVLIDDPVDDSTNVTVGGVVTTNFHEITKVYMAYTKNNLYLGFKSPSYPDGTTWSLYNAGGSYIFIDNGITEGEYSKGPVLLTSSGLQEAGISGELGNFDQVGNKSTNGRKFTMFVKHYRPVTKDMISYHFATGAVRKEIFSSSSTVGWATITTNSVTEIQIPLRYIFGNAATNIPTFYLIFKVDGALAENNVGADQVTNAGSVDFAPFNPLTSGAFLTNWIAISNLTK